jgi:hypothetical protein
MTRLTTLRAQTIWELGSRCPAVFTMRLMRLKKKAAAIQLKFK